MKKVKAKVKTKAKKSNKKSAIAQPVSYREPKSVNIKKATNGYVVSSYGQNGEVIKVAKTKAEANKLASSLLEK